MLAGCLGMSGDLAYSVLPFRASMMMALLAEMFLLNESPGAYFWIAILFFALPFALEATALFLTLRFAFETTAAFLAEEDFDLTLWRANLRLVFLFVETTFLDTRVERVILPVVFLFLSTTFFEVLVVRFMVCC